MHMLIQIDVTFVISISAVTSRLYNYEFLSCSLLNLSAIV